MDSSRPVEAPKGGDSPSRAKLRRNRSIAIGLSVAVHLGALVALLAVRAPLQRIVEEQTPALVSLITPPNPRDLKSPDPNPLPAAAHAAAKPTAQALVKAHVAALPPPPEVKPLPAAKTVAPQPVPSLTEAELATAATAEGEGGSGSGGGGGGGGGGSCNMIRRLQAALRKDRRVQAAAMVPTTTGKAVRVWNGDWVQSGDEDGRGLAAVREAISWEVGFAPEACKNQPQHGLVVLSLADGPGATRLAVGAAAWRWVDLTH